MHNAGKVCTFVKSVCTIYFLEISLWDHEFVRTASSSIWQTPKEAVKITESPCTGKVSFSLNSCLNSLFFKSTNLCMWSCFQYFRAPLPQTYTSFFVAYSDFFELISTIFGGFFELFYNHSFIFAFVFPKSSFYIQPVIETFRMSNCRGHFNFSIA